jgi:peptide/nickel transport system substrate-binding protein
VANSVRKLTWLVGVVAVFAVASAMGASAHTTKSSNAKSGGTFNVGWEQSFGFTDNGDPTGEYLGDWFGIADNLLVRTLIGYTHQPGGPGNVPIADIATKVPKPTNGGKTYTFDIKQGVMFSPPVSRQVECKDFVNAMQRLANPKDGGEYAFYYTVIKGWSQYAAGKAKSISGISCPNTSTIVFNLTAPTGDFLKRMGMPATGPQPAEVTKCFEGQPGKYGLDLISTAGYMYKGIDSLNISSCSGVKATPGYDGQTIMDLVRNPNYKQSTDPYRKNAPDEFRFLIDASNVDIFNKVEAGQLDYGHSSLPNNVIKKYATDPSLKNYFHQNSGDRTWYLTMNITQPPFDDIHVRRAMNWIIDKAALRQIWGGPTVGDIANHIVPDSLFGGQLADYKPYRTAGDHGSVAKAKLAMKGSGYSDKTGMCVASVCKNVLMIADTRGVDPGMVNVIQQDAKRIGITFTVRTVNGAYPTIQTVAKNVPLGERPGWGKDYADALTFFSPLFDGRTIIPTGNTNYSLVGITKSQCTTLKVTGDCNPYDAKTGLGVPNVDSQLDKCSVLIDPARQACYENLDKFLTTNVVPWVPWMWSKVTAITSTNVTHYQFDQFSTTPAYSEMTLK